MEVMGAEDKIVCPETREFTTCPRHGFTALVGQACSCLEPIADYTPTECRCGDQGKLYCWGCNAVVEDPILVTYELIEAKRIPADQAVRPIPDVNAGPR